MSDIEKVRQEVQLSALQREIIEEHLSLDKEPDENVKLAIVFKDGRGLEGTVRELRERIKNLTMQSCLEA
jgi:hypothetical protein